MSRLPRSARLICCVATWKPPTVTAVGALWVEELGNLGHCQLTCGSVAADQQPTLLRAATMAAVTMAELDEARRGGGGLGAAPSGDGLPRCGPRRQDPHGVRRITVGQA